MFVHIFELKFTIPNAAPGPGGVFDLRTFLPLSFQLLLKFDLDDQSTTSAFSVVSHSPIVHHDMSPTFPNI